MIDEEDDPGKIEKSNPEKKLAKEGEKDFFNHKLKCQIYNIVKNCNIKFLLL